MPVRPNKSEKKKLIKKWRFFASMIKTLSLAIDWMASDMENELAGELGYTDLRNARLLARTAIAHFESDFQDYLDLWENNN